MYRTRVDGRWRDTLNSQTSESKEDGKYIFYQVQEKKRIMLGGNSYNVIMMMMISELVP